MSRPAYLADHNFNEAVLEGVLRIEPAIQVTRVREVGLEEWEDPEILEWAARKNLITLSHDVNTMIQYANDRLALNQRMTGLLVVRQQPIALRAVIENLVLIWSASEAEEWDGKVRFLPF